MTTWWKKAQEELKPIGQGGPTRPAGPTPTFVSFNGPVEDPPSGRRLAGCGLDKSRNPMSFETKMDMGMEPEGKRASSSSKDCLQGPKTAKEIVLGSGDLFRLIGSWLFLPEAASCRRVNRKWFKDASIMLRDLWLDWFFSESIPYDLPIAQKRAALDNVISIGRMVQSRDVEEPDDDAEKFAQDADLVRKGELALTMQPLAFPNWDAEVRQLCETPLNADTWGQRIAKWFAEHCGLCGDMVAKVGSGTTLANNVRYDASHICEDCVRHQHCLERVDSLSDPDDNVHVPLALATAFSLFHSPDPHVKNRDVVWMFTADAHALRSRFRESTAAREEKQEEFEASQRKWRADKLDRERKARLAQDRKRKRDERSDAEKEAEKERARKRRREKKNQEEAWKRQLEDKEREIQSLRDQVAMGRGRDANSPIDLS